MARQTLKPPFRYFGGKTILAPEIAKLLPPHDHYVEPFAGSLAVLLAKEPSEAETVNDLDGDLITFWRVLRDNPDELHRVCQHTPYARQELEMAENLGGISDLEKARRVWVRLTQSRQNSLRDKPGWRRSFTNHAWSPTDKKAHSLRMPAVADRISLLQIENRDAVEAIEEYGTEKSVCIYADPPYLGSVRGKNYGAEMMEDDLHIRFANACRQATASVIISGYDSPLYQELFGDWHRYEFKAPPNLAGTETQTEVLWSNVPLGDQKSLF